MIVRPVHVQIMEVIGGTVQYVLRQFVPKAQEFIVQEKIGRSHGSQLASSDRFVKGDNESRETISISSSWTLSIISVGCG